MSQLRELSTLVRVTRASILIIERFVDAFNFNLDCEKVPFRIQRLDELVKRHMAALVDLELSTDDTQTREEYTNQRVDMEDRYNRLRDFLASHGPTTPDPAAALCPPPVSIPSGCSVCSRPHRTTVCVQYLRLPYDQKQEVVQQKNLCQNCLSASHPTRECSSNLCWRCRQKHHVSLHPPSPGDRPPLTWSRKNAVSQPSERTLTPLTQTEALTLTPTPEHNHPQPAVPREIYIVPLGAASRASLSDAVELDFASPLPAKVEVYGPKRKAKLAQGSSFSYRIAVDLDVVSLQSILTEEQLRRSLRCCSSFTGGGLLDWLLRIQCTSGPVLLGTRKPELHALGTIGNLSQELTPLAGSAVNTLAHSCSLEAAPIWIKRSPSPKHGSLDDKTLKLDAQAMPTGVTPPDFNKLKLAFLGRYSPLLRTPQIGLSCSLKRPGVSSTTSPYLPAEDLSPTWSVDQAQCWLEVDRPVDRGALPVGGRRGQPTSARKQKLFLLANRFFRKMTLASAHSPLLHVGPPFGSNPRNMARKEFDTNRRGRPPDLKRKTSLRRTVGTKFNVDNVTHRTVAVVRALNHHLRRAIGTEALTTEAMHTVLCQIESCLNSRPLTAVSENPNDVTAITPGHFLVGSALQSIPEPDLSGVPTNRLSLWQAIQRKTQQFWKLWTTDYLHQLQQRTKDLYRQPNLLVGKLVLLKEINLPPLRWSMGRITAVRPGPDGLVRVVSVKVPSGAVYDRPVVKVCLLPINDLSPADNPEDDESPSQSANSEDKSVKC